MLLADTTVLAWTRCRITAADVRPRNCPMGEIKKIVRRGEIDREKSEVEKRERARWRWEDGRKKRL